MKFLIDMNLPPEWCGVLRQQEWEAVHWSNIGDPRAPDAVIMAYAMEHGYAIFTHDLDFSAILAATRTRAPSVIQIRTQDVLSPAFRQLAITTMQRFQSEIEAGALVVVEEHRSRIRMLPLR